MVLWPLLALLQYGDNHQREVEGLWSALCTWPSNIRVTLRYLARLTCVAGNLSLMLRQAKRIAVCFSRQQAQAIVSELISELKVSCVRCLQSEIMCLGIAFPRVNACLKYMPALIHAYGNAMQCTNSKQWVSNKRRV